MNYKETLFFIGKCLTITHEKSNRTLIEQELKSNNINWNNIVKVSTAHYVFPALYCNLKRADFLHFLPDELVSYMQHITNLNRERNQQIINEAKEINELLLKNNITPVFLKGTGNLLDNLYEDIAERMLGDIDFLVSDSDFKKTISVLTEKKYFKKNTLVDASAFHRHYPKITKKGKIAAVEIHYKMVSDQKKFNYNYVKDSFKKLSNNTTVLSSENQLLMTCFNKQINDKGQWTKNISLRNSYDLYLQSKHASAKTVLHNFKYYKSYFNNFIASTNLIFNHPKSLEYIATSKTKRFIKMQLLLIKKPKLYNFYQNLWEFYFLYTHRLSVVIKAIYKKDYRIFLLKRLFS
ncbi:nucleotidyltransferase family protein [Tenacibaculum insulae]|uniref:nucleotidyltransferase domain-containing protein n=1 Tax=Tenacibaculum insulae TaxID=2029677 RepID=UPI003AB53635